MALTSKQYLDIEGLKAFWAKAKTYIEANSADSGEVQSAINTVALAYDSATKKINLTNGSTSLGSVDCTDFIKDAFVKSGKVVTGTDGKTKLQLTLITVERPGDTGTESTVDIDVTDLVKVDASNITLSDGTTVESAVSDLKGADTTNSNAITQEIADRKQADADLESSLTTAYKAADKVIADNLTQEIADRKSGDSEVYAAITAISTTDVEALFS
jgi:hypothetical protein